jgi:hypothetical protein
MAIQSLMGANLAPNLPEVTRIAHILSIFEFGTKGDNWGQLKSLP